MFGYPGLVTFLLKGVKGCTVKYKCPLSSPAPIKLRHLRAENQSRQRWSIILCNKVFQIQGDLKTALYKDQTRGDILQKSGLHVIDY